MALSESALQGRIMSRLKKSGWECLKVVMCNRGGWPDISCFKDGVCFFIEVKRKNEVPKPLQLHVHSVLREQGFNVYVIDDFTNLNQITEIEI